ncbi:hypothetical protein [Burkholderia ubonensis]|uniref:hypothetical protein n=1 Tax=Burkholderia ubonensis TaxID=101571 RepID=UPI00075A16F2|nr:hypothetical protein [Burkholderia ubonensis]KVP75388.1 hypothetical protein WJ93_08200 [Burkholderia ubonensis]
MQVTTLNPTTLGSLGLGAGLQAGNLPVAAPAAPAMPAGLVLPQNFPMNLDAQQFAVIQARVDQFDFASLPAQQIALLGQEPTIHLNRVLDGFLERVNKAENPQLFKLVDTLSDEIAKEKIGDLAEEILSAKPSLKYRILGFFSKKKLQEGLDLVYEELGRSARLKSKTLSDVVQKMERTLVTEMNKLIQELGNMDVVKAEYRNAFVMFAIEVAFLTNALAKAQAQAPALLAAADKDVMLQQEIQDKLQALESVALSREAMMTRLPAEQLITRQLQSAGVQTLQELSVTMGDRFASIRATLLGLHGANLVRNVQRLGQSNANLDNQLQEARAKLMGTVVTTAAHAAGNNRVDQANNLKRVVTDTANLQDIVEKSREANRVKFDEARNTMANVRQDLLALGQKINPGATVAAQTY